MQASVRHFFAAMVFGTAVLAPAHAATATGLDVSRSNREVVAKHILNTDHAQTPSTSSPNTWIDQNHQQTQSQLNTWSQHIDDWFGEPDPSQPASVRVRAILDQSWSAEDGYHVRPRIRANVKLPTLKRHWSVVFGDDDLENEFKQHAHLSTNQISTQKKSPNALKPSEERPQSLALRLSKSAREAGVDTDLDLGLRSGRDVYLRAKASKDWHFDQQYRLRLEQMVRYGSESQTFVRSNAEIKQQLQDDVAWGNQLSVSYEDKDQGSGLKWHNSLYAEHQFFKDQRLSYGVSASGSEKKNHLNSYGPFASWRQPIGREWFFVQGDINYQNDEDSEREHELGTFMRLEAIF